MDETQFLLFKKMVELVKLQEARIQQLERQISPFPQVIDLSEDVAELDQLIRELPGVHFRDPGSPLKERIERIKLNSKKSRHLEL